MLRAASRASLLEGDPLGVASFPLVPYSNRIGFGRFEWQGVGFVLEQNAPAEPHALHGVGFRRPWQVRAVAADAATLVLLHRPDQAWPWAFEARQDIVIGQGELTLELRAVNLEPKPVPLAFGHHPYLQAAGASLSFAATGVWIAGRDGLPSERVAPSGAFDFAAPRSVATANVDHCYDGWDGVARVRWADRPLALEIVASATLPNAVVYIPPGGDAFCVEPVPHVTNALNLDRRAAPMPVIGPREAFRATIRLRTFRPRA